MSPAPIAQYPTPYGVSIPVFGEPENPDSYVYDIDGTMTMAGIHGKEARSRCKAAILESMRAGGVRFQILLDHGGQLVPKVSLPRPRRPVYPTLPRGAEQDIPIEAWVTRVLELPFWNERAAALLDILDGNIQQTNTWNAPPEIAALALQQLLTGTLEHLPEAEIDCLEAAAFYALTGHPEWRNAGLAWLGPFSTTWFLDWATKRKIYRRFAAMCRRLDPDLPAWLIPGDAA